MKIVIKSTMRMIVLAVFLAILPYAYGYPEIGLHSNLDSSVARTSAGWQKISGWKVNPFAVSSRYIVYLDLIGEADLRIPTSGIYFVAVTMTIMNGEVGRFRCSLIIDELTNLNTQGLTSEIENATGTTHTLTFSGFVSLRAGEDVSIYTWSSMDASWSINAGASYTLHFIGIVGSTPGFLAHVVNNTIISSPSNAVIRPYQVADRAKLFSSLSGLSVTDGTFTTACAGLFVVSANIIFQGPAGYYEVAIALNNEISLRARRSLTSNGRVTLNLLTTYMLNKDVIISLRLTSNANTFTIIDYSQWSITFIGTELTSGQREFSTPFAQNYTGSTTFQEISHYLSTSSFTGRYFQPQSLSLFNTDKFVVSDAASFYYVFVNFEVSGDAEVIDFYVGVNLSPAAPANAMISRLVKRNGETATISFGAIFDVEKGAFINMIARSQSGSFTIHNSSAVSFIRMRYLLPSVSARVNPLRTFQATGFQELNTNYLTQTKGLYSFGTSFSAANGRYTASRNGIYYVAANILFENLDNTIIEAIAAVDGKINTKAGLYAINSNPGSKTTLNIYGSIYLRQGQYVSIFVSSSSDNNYNIGTRSALSVSYIGPNWHVQGFSAVLASSTNITSTDVTIGGWTIAKSGLTTPFNNDANFNEGTGVWTADSDAIYLISANIFLRNTRNSSVGEIRIRPIIGGVKGDIGVTDSRASPITGNDWYTLSISGPLRFTNATQVALQILSTVDGFFTISEESSFSIIKWGETTVDPNFGIASATITVGIKSGANVFHGLTLSTTNPLTVSGGQILRGTFSLGSGFDQQQSVFIYKIQAPGVYFVSASFILLGANGPNFDLSVRLNGEDIEYGLYAFDGGSLSSTFTLNFAGTLYLVQDEVVSVYIRSTATSFTVAGGTGFSVVKLQIAPRDPGFSIDKHEPNFNVASTQLLTNFQELTDPGLIVSNLGLDSVAAMYTIQTSGIYILSLSANTMSTPASSSTAVGVYSPAMGANLVTGTAVSGVSRTTMASRAVLIANNTGLRFQFNTSETFTGTFNTGWSVFFLRTLQKVTGISGILPFSLPLTAAWQQIRIWASDSLSYPSNPFSSVSQFIIPSAGIYLSTVVGDFTMDIQGLARIAVYVNNTRLQESAWTSSSMFSISLTGTLQLNPGDILSFRASGAATESELSPGSSMSVTKVNDVDEIREGFSAYRPATTSHTMSNSTPVAVTGWQTTGKPGLFAAAPYTLNAEGQLVSTQAAVYYLSANIKVQEKANQARTFWLYGRVNGRSQSPVQLITRQMVSASTAVTLSIGTSIFLNRFDRVRFYVQASDELPFDIQSGSTLSMALIDNRQGEAYCSDISLGVNPLNPTFRRISTDSTTTFTCQPTGLTTVTYIWRKNGAVLPGVNTMTLTFPKTTLADSGLYSCTVSFESHTATTANATLDVYDPTPRTTNIIPTTGEVTENMPANTGVSIITVAAVKFSSGPASVGIQITAGDPRNEFAITPVSTEQVRLTTLKPLDYETQSFYTLTILLTNLNETNANTTSFQYNVSIKDVNDQRPILNVTRLMRVYPENLQIGSVIAQVVATDRDPGENGKITYALVGQSFFPFFRINSTTGVISLNNSMDRETLDQHVVTFTATDGHFTAVGILLINVTDVNDNEPKFAQAMANISVLENTPVGSSVYRVSATDIDEGANQTVRYRILSSFPAANFSINTETGVVSISSMLDEEVFNEYTIIIQAYDLGSPKLISSNFTLTIIILDFNDKFPQFTMSQYTRTIPENMAVGSFVLQVTAMDSDRTLVNSRIVYSIPNSISSEYFEINSAGNITIKKSPNYETIRAFHFSVIARDTATVPNQRSTSVIIIITDVNDNAPVFTPSEYRLNVSEATRPGTSVLRVIAQDNDTATLTKLSYSKVAGDDNNFFLLLSNGDLIVNKELDRETNDSFTIRVSVSDSMLSAVTQAVIEITILDENDNRPLFESSTYLVSIAESASVGTDVIKVSATDADIGTNKMITYTIVTPSHNPSSALFSINGTTGQIKVAGSLDFEEQTVHILTVAATDHGRAPLQGTTEVRINVTNVNDSTIIFSSKVYNASVLETVPLNSFIHEVTARNREAGRSNEVRYSITAGNLAGKFSIDAMTGVISSSGLFDFENRTMYVLTVTASDPLNAMNSVTATVNIQILEYNDNHPAFVQSYYTVTIAEDTPPNQSILRLNATDKDAGSLSGAVRYRAIYNTTDFTIEPETGIIRVARNLDFEVQKLYNLVVLVEDLGTPTLSGIALLDIFVSDTNERPVFSQTTFTVSVNEKALIGTSVLRVAAADEDTGVNGQLSYYIVDQLTNNFVFRLTTSGDVILNALLNHENRTQYQFRVMANDSGTPPLQSSNNALVTITITDDNDFQPQFDVNTYSRTISEGVFMGTIITVRATDSDSTSPNNNIQYWIVPSVDAGNFTINHSNGIITSAVDFDRELISVYTFEVEARDSGRDILSGRARVVIYISDINDNDPEPSSPSYMANVTEVAFVGTQVIRVSGTDRDIGVNAKLSFQITSGNDGDKFSINADTGVISVKQKLSFLIQAVYNLVVVVRDNGTPTNRQVNVPVTINVVRHTGGFVFTQDKYTFTINEGDTRNPLGQVIARDSNNVTGTTVVYTMGSSQTVIPLQGLFTLNTTTGEVFMTTPFDFETASHYGFAVTARSNRDQNAFAVVVVEVLDVNERPYFTNDVNGQYFVNVSEHVAVGTHIFSVSARDNDTQGTNNSMLTYTLYLDSSFNRRFSISTLGQIILTEPLDHENRTQYVFTVEVKDKGNPPLGVNSTVTLTVLDYNDNAPFFDTPQMSVSMSANEGVVIGTLLGELFGKDRDSGVNAQLLYTAILPSGYLRYGTNGEVQTARVFDYETIQSYELVAFVEDRGTPSLKGTILINLSIVNVNDNRPVFLPMVYRVTVSETAVIGTLITRVFASDIDLGSFGEIRRFAIVDGNTETTFRIDNTGHIYSERALNFTRLSSYNLTIQAYDGGSPALNASTAAIVYITVRDVSNMQPVFVLNSYVATIMENLPAPFFVINVTANTPEANSGPIEYSIVPGNDSSSFTINNATGTINSVVSYDFEGQRRYSVLLQATDKANGLTGHAHLFVQVTDVNDNVPVITINKLLHNISDSTSPASVVAGMTATDADSGNNGEVFFSSGGGSGITLGIFAVNPDGTVILVGNLDSRVNNVYTVIAVATDRGMPALSSNVTLTIFIHEATVPRLNEPLFDRDQYMVSVFENETAIDLLTVRTTNVVAGIGVTYSLLGAAEETAPFTINQTTGVLSLTSPLNYELKSLYYFFVRAVTDSGRLDVASVIVQVLDLNDNGPRFQFSSYSKNISEVSPVGMILFRLGILDNDTSSVNGPYRYSIESGDHLGFFSIDDHGVLRVAKKLDRESNTTFNMVVKVSENGMRNATTMVVITLSDANDVVPIFDPAMYEFTVQENATVGTLLGTVIASDADATNLNTRLLFSLVNTSTNFRIDSPGFTGLVILNAQLDYEKAQLLEAIVIARNIQAPNLQAAVVVRINVTDINDNLPIFSNLVYNNTVAERTPVGTIVAIVLATDLDSGMYGQVSYTLYEQSGTFSIDNAGNIILRKDLNYEGVRFYTMEVSAMDGGSQRSTKNATVNIWVSEVNDNQPYFRQSYYYFRVSERENRGYRIGNVTALDDREYMGRIIKYAIVASSVSKHFNVSATGELSLNETIDYDTLPLPHTIAFQVEAWDAGTPSLTATCQVIIMVEDANDNAPMFSPVTKKVNVSETAELGTVVAVFDIRDLDVSSNGKFSVAIEGGSTTFSVDNQGVVRLIKLLDFKTQSTYTLNITAIDQGSPALTGRGMLWVNVIPAVINRPVFMQRHYVVSVMESLPLNSIVVQLNVSSTVAGTTFSLTIPNNIGFPELTADSAARAIKLQAPGLDFERRNQYYFTVIASNDLGYTDTATVIVHVLNVNEHAPYFRQSVYNVTISELSFLGFTVFDLVGMDNDTGSAGLTYNIVSGNSNNDFRIENAKIVVNEAFQQTVYMLNVSVRDPGGLTGFTTVIINIQSEQSPTFTEDIYIVSVFENVSISTSILQIIAGTPTRGINYTIEDAAVMTTFEIDRISGIIRNKVMLNHENRSQYIFPVMAKVATPVMLYDGATVVINVLNVNDLPPVFTQPERRLNISERHPVGSRVVTMHIVDRDTTSGLTFSIVSGDPSKDFNINNNGQVTLEKALNFDTRTNYTLRIRVFDGVHEALTNLYIQVIEVTNCVPEFGSSLYEYTVLENLTVSSVLSPALQVINTPLARTTMQIADTTTMLTWSLQNGNIMLQRKLDFETQAYYFFKVNATFSGLVGQTAVFITVINLDDERPVIYPSNSTVSLSERTVIGNEVITVNATDADTPRLRYYIAMGNTNNTFTIDDRGTISLAKKLDFETTRNYTLTINVSDGIGMAKSYVNINVLDVIEVFTCFINL